VQQEAFKTMLGAATSDEEAAELARKNFEDASATLFITRGKAADSLARLAPPHAESGLQPATPATAAVVAPRAVAGPAPTPLFYALQTRTLTPMLDGGHPIDAPNSPAVGLHGLVGGTTWTYGFQWPHVKCDQECHDHIKRDLDAQLALYCSSQSDTKKCLADGLPFTPEMYDLVVSMGSSHVAIEDLATRVVFDGATFGEFSRENKEIFASLSGRQFDTLDCHSNGAMLCLAALRSGDTTAKVVRLFGPQINPEAANRWQEYAAETNTKIEIYLNQGDPITAISWKQPTPQTLAGKAATGAWLANPVTGPATLADALFSAYVDSKSDLMGTTLKGYGFDVTRGKCQDLPSIDCHSMKLYEVLPRAN
jgi:hypothetical protein